MYNEMDVQDARDNARGTDLKPYAEFLYQWMEIINSNSDGWPYWDKGRKAADTLVEALYAVHAEFRPHFIPDEVDMDQVKKGVTRIRSAATRLNLPKPEVEGL